MELSYKQLIEYMKIHLISLEQDQDDVQKQLDDMEDMECDEYRQLEIEDIYLNGQMSGIRHILKYAGELEFDKPLYEGV